MELQRDGCTIIPGVISPLECESLRQEIVTAMDRQVAGPIETTGGRIVGGRNLLDCWAGWRRVFSRPSVAKLIADQVSRAAGVVRILYFDKPPGQGWSLSLHRDKTIAVAEHRSPALPFSKPTVKAGVPHVIATESLLRSMLTLRLHLDPMTQENGPLTVVPGSHLSSESKAKNASHTIQCNAGDVFAMRPLLLHGSLASEPTTLLHRRLVHLEIAPTEMLPGEYKWHRFARVFVSEA